MTDYISREAVIDALTERNLVVHMDSVNDGLVASCHRSAQRIIANIPAADVLPRDEAIKMGAELAAMHGSDATSQQLEDAYLKGVEDSMTRRDVRPVVSATWYDDGLYGMIKGRFYSCPVCKAQNVGKSNFCPNCGADMRPEPPKEE